MSLDERRKPLRHEDMDVVGNLFGLRFAASDIVELYIEDDEWYHYQTCFHKHWLLDLINVCQAGHRHIHFPTK